MRFKQPAYPTNYFSNKVYVKCPKCRALGLVKADLGRIIIPQPIGYNASFSCTSCHFSTSDHSDWFGYYQGTVSRPCGFCGSSLWHITEPTKSPTEMRKITCSACSKEREYEVRWRKYHDKMAIDPFFGFDLWLQLEVKGNTLWLYNLEHLQYLREYVQAKLRDDNTRHKYSMIANLPQWIISAKNRDLILKKLNRLESDLLKETGNS